MFGAELDEDEEADDHVVLAMHKCVPVYAYVCAADSHTAAPSAV